MRAPRSQSDVAMVPRLARRVSLVTARGRRSRRPDFAVNDRALAGARLLEESAINGVAVPWARSDIAEHPLDHVRAR